MKPRTENDRRVRKVMAAVARITASPHLRDRNAGVLDTAFEKIYMFGDSCARFDGDNWTPEAVRAIVLAIALNAPSKALDQLVVAAERAREFVEYWDERGWIEVETHEGDPRRWWEKQKRQPSADEAVAA